MLAMESSTQQHHVRKIKLQNSTHSNGLLLASWQAGPIEHARIALLTLIMSTC